MSGIAPVPTAIYRHELPAAAWQLLWWLVAKMDGNKELRGGWRAAAARDMGKDRVWIQRCAQKLAECNLIRAGRGERFVRVCVENFVGDSEP